MIQENELNEDEIDIFTSSMNETKETQWAVDHEIILVEWADKAMCYRWMHDRSNLAYSKMNLWFTIPVIVMSTITGVGNFAFQKYPIAIQNIASNIIGGVNIFAAILQTIAQFLKISELNEAHRVSAISWDKFYRNIKVELAKHPTERMNAIHMLKICKEEFDRLSETSPIINDNIINEFKTTFYDTKDLVKQKLFNSLKKPEICDELITTNESRHGWYKEINKNDNNNENIKLIELNNKKKILERHEKIISNFQESFINLHDRKPLENEIIDNLKDKIPEQIIIKLIEHINKKNSIAEKNNDNIKGDNNV